MRQQTRKKKIRIHAGRLAVSILVLLLIMAGLVFLFCSCGEKREARALEREQALELARQQEEEEKRLTEEKAAEEAAKAAIEQQAKADRLYAYENGFLILLNKSESVDEHYVPSDLTAVKEAYTCSDRPASTHVLREEAAKAFDALMDAAAKDGLDIRMTTAYRSYSYQNSLYTNYVNKYGQEEADTFSARPGTSEHQSGLAADLSAKSVNWQLTSKFGETEEGKWVAAHAAEYGFIIRYPEDTSDGRTSLERTGYVYEPWHIRYVTVPVAKEIEEQGLVLEEYLDQIDRETGSFNII